jgi:hypothetical protein
VDDGVGGAPTTIDYLPGNTDTYTPADGWRYGWSIGMESFERRYSHMQSSAWLDIDFLAADPADLHWGETEVAQQPKLAGEGPYYYYQPDTDPVTPGIQDPIYTFESRADTLSEEDVKHIKHWTESSWYGTTTYHDLFVGEKYVRTTYTHTVEADRPINVQFIGYDEGQVSVTSDTDVILKPSPTRREQRR